MTNPVSLLCALVNLPAEVSRLRDEMRYLMQRIIQLVTALDAKITALQASVAHNTEVEESAITLITGLKTQLDAAIAAAASGGATPEQLSSLVDLSGALDTEGGKLAAAVAANTPSTPSDQPSTPPADQPTV